MKSRILPLVALATTLASGSAVGQNAQHIPIPNGFKAEDVTPDGTIVVGIANTADGFIWRWQEDPAPTIVPGGWFSGTSADGTVLSGNIPDPDTGAEVAAIWTESEGWRSIGYLPNAGQCPSLSLSYDISGDGERIVGHSWDGCAGRGFLWTEADGLQELEILAPNSNNATVIATDGSLIGGFSKGSFFRAAATWSPDLSGDYYFGFNTAGEIMGMNNDASTLVGTVNLNVFGLKDAFVTQDGALVNLGSLDPGREAVAVDISEDLDVIVGYDFQGLGYWAWVWTPATGIESLQSRLTNLGVPDVPNLSACKAVSDDGTVIVGYTDFDGGWIATLPATTGTWTDLGNGLAGTKGIPTLAGAGSLIGNETTTIELNSALPSTTANLVLGLSRIDAPFKQGVMVASPDVIFYGLPVDSTGSLAIQFAWPTDLPDETAFYWQCWIEDARGPAGFSASNGLQSTTP